MLAIVSYPTLAETDRQWIESIRAKYDPQADRIAAHFTLVFPIDGLIDDLFGEVSAAAKSSQPIDFTIRRATPVRDPAGGGSHLFLLPQEGSGEITTLHDRLYEGVLAAHLRQDLPFTPHMTVAACANHEWCEALARDLDAAGRVMPGTLHRIDIVSVEDTGVHSLGAFVLG